MRSVHEILGWMLVVANAVVGLWALAAHWRPVLRGKALWVATAVAQVLIFVQVILGVVYQSSSGIEASGIHQFYGFVTLIFVGIIYSYQAQIERWRYLLYGFGGLFIMGMLLRTVFLQPVVGG